MWKTGKVVRTFLRNSQGMPMGSLETARIASRHCSNASQSPDNGSILNRIFESTPEMITTRIKLFSNLKKKHST